MNDVIVCEEFDNVKWGVSDADVKRLDELVGKIGEIKTKVQRTERDGMYVIGGFLQQGWIICDHAQAYGEWVKCGLVSTLLSKKMRQRARLMYLHFGERSELVKDVPQKGVYKLCAPKVNEHRENILEDILAHKDITNEVVDEAIEVWYPTPVKDEKPKHCSHFSPSQVERIWQVLNMCRTGASPSQITLDNSIKAIIGEP